MASPYLTWYLHCRQSLDTQYGIRKEYVFLVIGDSTLNVDNASDINIKEREYKGTNRLWELFTRKHLIIKRLWVTT
jgi:hypothetical protein